VGLLFLLFTLVPFIELYLLIRIGEVAGAWNTLLFVIAMGIVGAWLAKNQGRRVLGEWSRATSEGRLPEEGVLGGLLVLVGGLLLITPGVITDFVGLFFLLPWTRRLIARGLRNYFERKIQLGQVRVEQYGFAWPPGRNDRRPDIIDTEGEELR
jgi:UPF0716 protein FxsA